MEVNKISRLKFGGCYQSSVFRCGVFIPGRKYAPPEAKFFVFQNIGSATCPAKFKGIKKFKKSCVDLVYFNFCSGGIIHPYSTIFLRDPCGRANI